MVRLPTTDSNHSFIVMVVYSLIHKVKLCLALDLHLSLTLNPNDEFSSVENPVNTVESEANNIE